MGFKIRRLDRTCSDHQPQPTTPTTTSTAPLTTSAKPPTTTSPSAPSTPPLSATASANPPLATPSNSSNITASTVTGATNGIPPGNPPNAPPNTSQVVRAWSGWWNKAFSCIRPISNDPNTSHHRKRTHGKKFV